MLRYFIIRSTSIEELETFNTRRHIRAGYFLVNLPCMSKKQQVLIIHGGTTFKTHEDYIHFLESYDLALEKLTPKKDWKDSLQAELGEGFEVFQPRMPNGSNAQYQEWKLWFNKILSLLDDNVILVGHSLGGIFLAKYLSEEFSSKKVKAIFLIAAPFDDTGITESLGSFTLVKSFDMFKKQTEKIFLYFSKDDAVAPFVHAKKYLENLPEATLRIFEDRGHFKQANFPELVQDIKNLTD